MRKIKVFNNVSLDGYFADANSDMSWAHRGQDAEWNDFAASNASGGGTLMFGRITFELMAQHWPTPKGKQDNAGVAQGMGATQKIVFSKTLEKVDWQNTTIIRDDVVTATRKLKQEAGPDIVILGSGSLIAPLTDARLIDEYQVAVIPIVLGSGRTMFDGMKKKIELQLQKSRQFQNGNVVLWYAQR